MTESIIFNDENKVGVVLPDETFYQSGFDQKMGRVIWIKNLNDYHNGAVLYAVPVIEVLEQANVKDLRFKCKANRIEE
jgi:hypothetical protein